MKITDQNYLIEVDLIGSDKLPEALRDAHQVIIEKTDHGKNWKAMNSTSELRRLRKLAFEKLGKFIGTTNQTITLSPEQHSPQEEGKIIRRYGALDGKPAARSVLSHLLNLLQAAIRSGKIRKSSVYASEITRIQQHLVALCNDPAEGKAIRIPRKFHERLKAALQEIEAHQDRLPGIEGLEGTGLGELLPEGVMCSTDFANLEFKTIGFTGKWLELIGDPCPGFTAMVFGLPKTGKSFLCIDFAGYLARHHGRVLYVAKEEKLDATLQRKLNEKDVAHVNLYVSDRLLENLAPYDFIFLDSVNKLGLAPRDLEKLKQDHPGKSFIYIFQSNKDGNFRGNNEFQHDVDIVIEVPEAGKAVQFGRFNQGGAMDIFPSMAGDESLEGTGEIYEDGKRERIQAEFSIALHELADLTLDEDEQPDEINHLTDAHHARLNPVALSYARKFLEKQKSKVQIRYAIYKDKDSSNLDHGMAYFRCALFGDIGELKKIAGPDQFFYYEWEKPEERLPPASQIRGKKKLATLEKSLDKYDNGPDEVNPKYLFSRTTTHLLSELLLKKIDLEYLVRRELAARGCDASGHWVGFDEAKKIHGII